MASTKTYKLKGIVLRKTKLADKDLIITILAESGEECRAVAKGARKPGGSLAARLELFTTCDLMLARGRSLDVVTEARISPGCDMKTLGLEQSACASVVAELICHVAQQGLEQPRLFDMTAAAFSAIAQERPEQALLVTVADLIKTMALMGYRPSLSSCISCGRAIEYDRDDMRIPVSIIDGGVVCPSCPRPSDSVLIEPGIAQWHNALLTSTFSEIATFKIDLSTTFDLLQFVRQWIRVHTGRDLKSFDFLFTAGIF